MLTTVSACFFSSFLPVISFLPGFTGFGFFAIELLPSPMQPPARTQRTTLTYTSRLRKACVFRVVFFSSFFAAASFFPDLTGFGLFIVPLFPVFLE